jgi:hypothetical protein
LLSSPPEPNDALRALFQNDRPWFSA